MAKTFGAWLKAQQHRSDPVGDLARDFVSACRWRNENPAAKTRDHVAFQMGCLGASADAYEALDVAAAEWQASR